VTLDELNGLSIPAAVAVYVARGWSVVPLEPRSKAVAGENADWLRLRFQPSDFRPEDNVGLRSVDGLVVIDLDAPEVVALADRFMPETGCVWGRPSKPRSKRVYLSVFPKTVALKDADTDRGGQLLEIRSSHQDMCVPSTHPDGERLTWSVYGDVATVDSLALMRACRLLATAALIARYYAGGGQRHEWCLALSGTLRSMNVTSGECTNVISAAAFHAGDGKLQDRLTEVRTTYARGDDDPIQGKKALKDLSSPVFVKSLQRIWGSAASEFLTDDTGDHILANSQENIRRALDKLDALLSYNTFSEKPIIKLNGYHGPLDDVRRRELWFTIDSRFKFRPAPEFFQEAILYLAEQNNFHPVRMYLEALEWDGVPRVDTWLVRHARAADSPYVRAVSSLVLVAAVRRVMKPGCKFDELLVLESTQGKFKSSAIRTLCPNPDWFSDDLPLNVDSKQVIERTLGKWIIEAADLSGLSGAAGDHLKSMLSRGTDGPVRLAYARMPISRDRQWVPFGTTNSHNYLKDATGGRRFWPVRVDKFDVVGIERERDQLWAEAAHREKMGESIRLDASLFEHAGVQQERRRVIDDWEDAVMVYVGENDKKNVSRDEVWNALAIPTAHRDEKGSVRLGQIMQRLNFRRGKVSRDGQKLNGWIFNEEETLFNKREEE
jgi:predicted P-loop ATPase